MNDQEEALTDTQTQTPNVCKSLDSQEPEKVWGRLFATTVHLRSVDLFNPSFALGRSKDCDIVIDSSNFQTSLLTTISKTHFVITRSERNLTTFIKDLSKNGTYVNGKILGRDKKIVLQHDDQISISLGSQVKKVYVYKTILSGETSYLPLELKKKYEISKVLGSGTYGEVRLVFEKETCQEYAVKKIGNPKMGSSCSSLETNSKKIQNEIDILKALSHPCIISMKEIVKTKEAVYIILEYMEGGELLKRIDDTLTENTTKIIFYQLIDGVKYLHSKGITHRDLKPGNILLKSTDKIDPLVKISDFGLSKMIDNANLMSTMCGTPYFVAPEVIDKKCARYTKQVDIWSLGVLLFLMLSKELPFMRISQSELFALILSGHYVMKESKWKDVSDQAKDLVENMLVLVPEDRIKIDAIFEDSWLSDDVDTCDKARRIIDDELSRIEGKAMMEAYNNKQADEEGGSAAKKRRFN